jgi:hypothetical protein
MISDLDELALKEFILSVNLSTSSGKFAFNMIKWFKNIYYAEFNTEMVWERLKSKYEPTSAHSLVKTERIFRQRSLCKNQDPDFNP